MAYQTVDPILVASEVVGALQSIASRNTHPLDSVVVSVTQIHAGDAYNVIPPSVALRGTVRTYRDEVTDLAEARMRQRSEEHTSELQSLMRISYAVFCLKKNKRKMQQHINPVLQDCSSSYQTGNAD